MTSTRTLIALVLFGIGFGYVEAAVVVCLRTIFGPVRHETFHAVPHNELFPLLQAEHLQAAGPNRRGRASATRGSDARSPYSRPGC